MGMCKKRKGAGKKREHKKGQIFSHTQVSLETKEKREGTEDNDTRKKQDFSTKVNSNADEKVKDGRKSQRKTPYTSSFPILLDISFHCSIHKKKLGI
jgi:hypothetical protein